MMISRPALGFILSLVVPSIAIVNKYLGLSGVIAYGVTATLVLALVHRHLDRLARDITGRQATALGLAALLLLVLAFSVGYPLANSGVLGPGTDRDEHINIGATELLHGRYPYYQVPPVYESFISQMPGALLLAVPFVAVGNGAYQNLFWLGAFVATGAWLFKGIGPALLLTLVILCTSPIVINEYVTGGDLLANSLYVLLFTIWLVHVAPEPGVGRWQKLVAAVALGIGLSSRGHFVLLLPLVCSALVRRGGLGLGARYTAVVCAAFGAVTLPFYLYDPRAFAPLETIGFLQPASLPSFFGVALACTAAALAGVCAMDRANGDLSRLLRYCTLVLAFPILTSAGISLLEGITLEFSGVNFGLSFVFFGALAFMPGGRRFPN